MPALVEFLQGLFAEGRAVLRGPPETSPGRAEAIGVLRQAYATYRLEVAGPPVDFDAATALAAGEFVHRACWFLVRHDQPDADLDRTLVMPGPPRTPGHHLSADLVLRFLPQVHQRARALDPADRLTALLARVLREWPLTGVLSAVEEGPLTPPDFGHPGLLLLYAERLARSDKPAWVPEGPGWEYVELVWRELRKDPSALARATGPAGGPDRGDDGGARG